ncbi:MAG: PP2C family protein-serine/threonine phosphatase [Planctomycetes bacterium]|nr:PP2C family protein-serine/threonine phosphatase [Planctomycetota bacterium]
MTLHSGYRELLATVPGVVSGAGVRVLDPDGVEVMRFGEPGAGGAEEFRCPIAGGEIVTSLAEADPAASALVSSLLALVDERERLESDMESMNASSLRLLEQVAMLGETLPRLSAGVDEHDIAKLGAKACQVAAAVERVMFLASVTGKDSCEVLVDHVVDAVASEVGVLDPLVQVGDGLLADVLAVGEGVVLRSVPDGERLGQPGSPEHLARRQILGVPVTYGAGDKRVVIGALLLFDKTATSYSSDDQLGSEEGQVAESFAAMLGAVLGARKTAELGKELAMAQMIQRQILPRRAIELAGFDVAADYQACGAVGGDYFDYVPMADGRTMVVIADVSGHNLASGMMMVSARATLRTLASVRSSLAEFFDDFAASMYEDLTSTERFLTAAALAIEPNDRRIEYVSAGHNDLLVYRAAADRVEVVQTENTILGFMPRPGYVSRHIILERGDCLLLFTDGITEAVNEQDEMFGDDRLAALFAQLAPERTARAIVDGIVEAVDAFRGGEIVGDDVTAVVVKCTGERVN